MSTNHQEIIDISRGLTRNLAHWPSDTQFDFSLVASMESGSNINVGSLRLSTHFGTHVDAPYHFDSMAETVGMLSLSTFIGPAQVVDISGSAIITAQMLAAVSIGRSPRLLIRTDAWPETAAFPTSVPVLELAAVDYLAEQGVVLLGLDLPSVDPLDSKALDNHHALHRHEIAILESLNLEAVEPGDYELIALPLKIVGGDASPVRAVLRRPSLAWLLCI